MTQVTDVHTHFIPEEFHDAGDHPEWGAYVEDREGSWWIVHEQGFAYPFDPTFLCGDAKLDDMSDRGIDRSIASLSPSLFYYWIDAADSIAFARMANDSLAKASAGSGGRIEGLASLPMQDPGAAAEELRRSVRELGLVGAQIGTTIEGEYVDHDRYDPVWAAANELEVAIVLHPYYVGPRTGFEDYYLTNIFVNPMDTALAASRIIFSGMLDRYPALRILLVHAGGFLPYQLGRLDHGWGVRDEPRVRIDRPPSEYIDRFYFDTITHNDSALRWLLDYVGDERVVMGTDLPFDMGDGDAVGRLRRVSENERELERVTSGNAVELFGLSDEP